MRTWSTLRSSPVTEEPGDPVGHVVDFVLAVPEGEETGARETVTALAPEVVEDHLRLGSRLGNPVLHSFAAHGASPRTSGEGIFHAGEGGIHVFHHVPVANERKRGDPHILRRECVVVGLEGATRGVEKGVDSRAVVSPVAPADDGECRRARGFFVNHQATVQGASR